jgi:hypothetical protein
MATMMTLETKSDKGSGVKGGGFLAQLDNLQNQQAQITQKCEKEKRKQSKLERRIDELQRTVLELQAATNNGARVIEDERACEKAIHRLEHKIQKLRVKLSMTRTANNKLVKSINEQRKDKNLNLEVLNGTEKQTEKVLSDIKEFNRQIVDLNEKKHTAKLDLTKAKTKMIVDMEDFKGEMAGAKDIMNENREALLAGIKEKMDLAMYAASISVPTRSQDEDEDFVGYEEPDTEAILANLMDSASVASLEELVASITSMENDEFRLYKEIQDLSGEVEEVEKVHKSLSKKLEVQGAAVDALDGQNDVRRMDLQKHITFIESQVASQQTQYKANMAIITGLSEPLLNILRSVTIEGEVQDSLFLNSGVNDRNVADFLSLIEQRVDFVMQLAKAAQNEALRQEDFQQGENVMSGAGVQPPTIPSMDDAGGDDGDDDDDDDTSKILPVDIKSVKKFMDQKLFPNKYKKFEKSGRRTVMGSVAKVAPAGGPAPAPPPQPAAAASVSVPEHVQEDVQEAQETPASPDREEMRASAPTN